MKIVKNLILQHKAWDLTDLEIAILEGAWKGQTYKEIAKDKNYSGSYLNDVGLKLWGYLSEALGKKVNKTNVRSIFEEKRRRGTQSNLSRRQTRLKNCFICFLLVTRNTCAESVGNIDNSCDLLVKDSINKLGQKPCGVENKKLTSENRQVACQLRFDRDTKLTDEIVVEVIDCFLYICTGEHLIYPEKNVICGVWNGEKYDDIANKTERSRCIDRKLCGSNCQCKYSPNYLRRNIANDLWSKLSEVFVFLDYEINKDNFKPTIEGWHEKMKSDSTCSY